jgi:hypothetical protein
LSLARLLLAIAIGAGCASSESREVIGNANSAAPMQGAQATPQVTLPDARREFAGTSVRITKAGLHGDALADVDTCGQCHTDVADQWRSSAHAFASFNNPVYRASVMRLRQEVGKNESQVCAGCHDPSLLVDGAMSQEIRPDDARAHAGITCRTCHGITDTHTDGNGSYALDLSEIPLPKDGDAESLQAHRARVGGQALRTPQMCGSCHRSFLNEDSGNKDRHLVGQDDVTPWMRSAYAGSHGARVDASVAQKDCRGCHMPKEAARFGDPSAKAGTITSHRFLGGNTWLASMRSDPAQLQKLNETMLKDAVSLYVSHVPNSAQFTFDVAVRNERVGHRFPGGVIDAADTWLEVRVLDAKGNLLASSGTTHENHADDDAHVFASHVTDETGKRLVARETHKFRAGVFNATIPPRDTSVIRYAFDRKAGTALPASVAVRVRYRTRTLGLQAAACNAFRTPEGQAFAAGGLRNVAKHLDPCRAQPIVDVAQKTLNLADPDTSFEANYALGQGLNRALQEYVDDARAPLVAALASARTKEERAAVQSELAHLTAREGREEETFEWAAAAEALVGSAPSLAHVRAKVLMSRWKWAEAAKHLQQAWRLAPKDDGLAAELAIALGGSNQPQAALEITQQGLQLQPRDWDLLRVQALSLEALAPAHQDVSRATDAFLNVRVPDDAPRLRAKCSATVPGCANERSPVHVHTLRSAGG